MSDLFAALDLGSNSFHLLLARRVGESFETVERIKEKVQLLRGFQGGRLDPAAFARGEACLARFAQRLAGVPRANLRVAGTHALREAADRDDFAAVVQATLGVPLEVIGGEEEARLIYLGVAHHAPCRAGEPRLVVDVGGGSTELAWGGPDGCSVTPGGVASYKVGCVSLTDAFFRPGVGQEDAYLAARSHARSLFHGMAGAAPDASVIGTSGTIESVQSVLAANGWEADSISASGLASLTDSILHRRFLVQAGLPGLAPERVDIFPAGVALLEALFDALGIADMRHVDASLQDGLLYRELGPPAQAQDLRERTVKRLMARFTVDEAQAARVQNTAFALFDACSIWWEDGARWRALLGWAAQLHQLGLAVAARHYHRHGAYVLQNADLRAFSHLEQQQLALLVRGHRRSFPGLAFRAYDDAVRRPLERLLALLRIAVILNRSHSDAHVPTVGARAEGDTLALTLPDGWLAAHPLSERELAVEVEQLAGAGLRLEYA